MKTNVLYSLVILSIFFQSCVVLLPHSGELVSAQPIEIPTYRDSTEYILNGSLSFSKGNGRGHYYGESGSLQYVDNVFDHQSLFGNLSYSKVAKYHHIGVGTSFYVGQLNLNSLQDFVGSVENKYALRKVIDNGLPDYSNNIGNIPSATSYYGGGFNFNLGFQIPTKYVNFRIINYQLNIFWDGGEYDNIRDKIHTLLTQGIDELYIPKSNAVFIDHMFYSELDFKISKSLAMHLKMGLGSSSYTDEYSPKATMSTLIGGSVLYKRFNISYNNRIINSFNVSSITMGYRIR
ncbi:hypothetical protein [Flammeovirga kamogawensis]|uniref:Transporter n=1 Tax=Flammeovirga kamogawensis TaxID=373891 RepID=A0ABX8H074_9BACT|nr:hypothetical protein [Flammeovirga kamogawensis]MBB6462309.1 hypothetical protein [Flammeovirga kamogawensis]QWG09301.1 hypothetical protein KM029_22100 [Flammeovirga kamogawensis]TRX64823.1 hypothetical protein EO216_20010 [Flammeovirga kamogawensis]